VPRIDVDDPRRDDVRALLRTHLDFAHAHSEPEDVHALDVEALTDPAVRFFSARDAGGRLLAVGALKSLDATHGEVKSMHTAQSARGTGVGAALLEHLVEVAREAGLQRVSLETGSMAAFAAARRLYARAGFTECAPFGDYVVAEASTFMTRTLATP